MGDCSYLQCTNSSLIRKLVYTYDCVVPAQQAITRLTAADYTFVDPGSEISTLQLLALAYNAIHDDALRVCSLEDAIAGLVKGLKEAEREYNGDENGIDDGGQAMSACCAGTFNKIINCLQGIHPDCNIIFITKETMNARFTPLAREQLEKHYRKIAIQIPKNLEYLDLNTSNRGSWKMAWEIIKPEVKQEMLIEFESYYATDKSKEKHIDDIIDAGKYLDLEPKDLESLRSCKDTTPQINARKRRPSC